MTDWKAVFATLPDQFTLDTMSAGKTADEIPRTSLRQVVARRLPKTKTPNGNKTEKAAWNTLDQERPVSGEYPIRTD